MTFQEDAQRFALAIMRSPEGRTTTLRYYSYERADQSRFGGDPRIYGLLEIGLAKGYCPPELATRLGIDVEEVRDLLFSAGVRRLEQPLFSASEVRRRNLETRLKAQGRDRINVMMGTTPSGEVHLANMYSLAGGAIVASDVCRRLDIVPNFSLGFNDLLVEGNQVPHIPQRLKVLQEFARRMGEAYAIPIQVVPYSELQREPAFRTMLGQLRDRDVLPDLQRARHGEHTFRDVTPARVNFANLTWVYRSDLLGLIGLRAYHGDVDVYVLGGDHRHIGRVFEVFNLMGKPAPHLVSMGVVYGLDGQEMHVSARNALPLTELAPDWIDVVGKLGDGPTDALGPIDYFSAIPPARQWNMYGIDLAAYRKMK